MQGFFYFLKGWQWLKSHPRYMGFLFLPACLAIFVVFLGWGTFVKYHEVILSSFVSVSNHWWTNFYNILVYGFTYLAVIIIGLILFMMLVNVFASPVYDYVSCVVEKDVYKTRVKSISFLASLQLIKEELKKVIFIAVVFFLVFLVPFLNVLLPCVSAVFLAWEICDYPLARRAWTFRQRVLFLRNNVVCVAGLSVWLVIPFLQFFLMPLAVVGGTMLVLDKISNDNV